MTQASKVMLSNLKRAEKISKIIEKHSFSCRCEDQNILKTLAKILKAIILIIFMFLDVITNVTMTIVN